MIALTRAEVEADHNAAALSAPGQLLEGVVPAVGPLPNLARDSSSRSRLARFAMRQQPAAAELGTRLVGVVATVEVHGGLTQGHRESVRRLWSSLWTTQTVSGSVALLFTSSSAEVRFTSVYECAIPAEPSPFPDQATFRCSERNEEFCAYLARDHAHPGVPCRDKPVSCLGVR